MTERGFATGDRRIKHTWTPSNRRNTCERVNGAITKARRKKPSRMFGNARFAVTTADHTNEEQSTKHSIHMAASQNRDH